MLTSVARYAVARGVPGLVNFVALALFTRLLDEYEYGRYTLIVAGSALAYALLLQWLSQGILRLAAPYAGGRGMFLATVARLFLPILLVAAVAMAVGTGITAGWHRGWLIAAGVGLLCAQSWHDLNLGLATADQLPQRYGGLSAIRALASLTLGALAASAGWGGTGVVAGVAVGGVLSGAWAYWLAWRPFRGAAVDPALKTELFRYGIPLAGAFVLAYVISAADRFLLAALISPSAAGVYAPAYDLVLQAMAALMMVVNLGAYPLAVAAMESGQTEVRLRQFRQHATLLLAVAVPAAAGIALLAPSVSGILGPRFSPSARELLPLLAVAQLFAGIKGYYFDLSFQLGRSTRLQFLTVAVAALVNIVLNLLLIPRMGIRGAAYATVAAYLAGLLLSWRLGRKVLALPIPYGAVARIGFATIGMCLVLVPFRKGEGPLFLAGQVGVGIAVYLLLLVLVARGELRRLTAQ